MGNFHDHQTWRARLAMHWNDHNIGSMVSGASSWMIQSDDLENPMICRLTIPGRSCHEKSLEEVFQSPTHATHGRIMAGYSWFGRKSAEPFVRRPEIHPDSNNLGVKVRCLGFFETNQNQRNWGFTMEMLAQFSDKRLQEEYSFGWQSRSPGVH